MLIFCSFIGFLFACLMLFVHLTIFIRAWKDLDILTKVIFLFLAWVYLWGGYLCIMPILALF